jgi:hypothetical protein
MKFSMLDYNIFGKILDWFFMQQLRLHESNIWSVIILWTNVILVLHWWSSMFNEVFVSL